LSQAFPAPTFGHAAEAFVLAHAAPGAWSPGTAMKYRQTLAATGPVAAGDVAVLGTPAGASALATRQSLEIYSRLALADAQQRYEEVIGDFPV